MNTVEIEMSVAHFFNYRQNMIVPNLSRGIYIHECDLLLISKAGYATEIEIKISKRDLRQDKCKEHGHVDHRIKSLYFAVPDFLVPNIEEHIPKRAGVLSIVSDKTQTRYMTVSIVRKAEITSDYKWSMEERLEVARLGVMKIWPTRKKILKLQEEMWDMK